MSFILNHPEAISLKDLILADSEHYLPSGDRLDVYFELKDGTHIAVEIKPSISLDNDITRGIFQYVKYYAVMDALRIIECAEYEIRTILVTARNFSIQHKALANELCVDYIEKITI